MRMRGGYGRKVYSYHNAYVFPYKHSFYRKQFVINQSQFFAPFLFLFTSASIDKSSFRVRTFLSCAFKHDTFRQILRLKSTKGSFASSTASGPPSPIRRRSYARGSASYEGRFYGTSVVKKSTERNLLYLLVLCLHSFHGTPVTEKSDRRKQKNRGSRVVFSSAPV